MAASLAAEAVPVAALAVLVALALLLAGDASGRLLLLRAVLPRRATQNVVSEPVVVPPGARVRLIVTAALDAPRGGIAAAAAPLAARARRAVGGRAPSPHGLLALALLALAFLAALRAADVESDWLAIAAVAPTVALVAGTFLFADLAFAAPGRDGDGSPHAVAAALAVVAALDRRPPRRLAVECVLTGAASGGQLGLRAYVRARRRGARPEELAVLAIGGVGGAELAHHPKEGRVLPARLHPELAVRAREAGLPELRGRVTGALPARLAGWPAMAITPSRSDDVIDRTVEACLDLVHRLDGQLDRDR
ncbi:MAG TPA: hypothetical protein VIL49_17515 [Capillimicrobium sp.]